MEDRVLAVNRIRKAILRYLRSHPDACDTLEGIWRWWLNDAAAATSDLEMRAAVEQLLRSGALVCRTLPDGTTVYAAGSGPQLQEEN